MSTLGAPLNDPPKEDQTEEEKFPTTEDELYQLFLKAVLHRFQTYAQPSDDFEADDYETHASTKEKAVSAVDRSTKVMKIVGLQAVLLDQSVHYYYMYLRGHYPSQQTLKGDINKAISAAENQIIQILEVWKNFGETSPTPEKVDGAHIFAVGIRKQSLDSFWGALQSFWELEKVEDWQKAVERPEMELRNILPLSPEAHWRWNRLLLPAANKAQVRPGAYLVCAGLRVEPDQQGDLEGGGGVRRGPLY